MIEPAGSPRSNIPVVPLLPYRSLQSLPVPKLLITCAPFTQHGSIVGSKHIVAISNRVLVWFAMNMRSCRRPSVCVSRANADPLTSPANAMRRASSTYDIRVLLLLVDYIENCELPLSCPPPKSTERPKRDAAPELTYSNLDLSLVESSLLKANL